MTTAQPQSAWALAKAPHPLAAPFECLSQSLGSAPMRGLRQALAQAPMVLLCAEGQALYGATAALPAFYAASQCPAVVSHPQGLHRLGAGVWRLTQLLVLWAGPTSHEALALAKQHHCPVLILGPAAACGDATWAMTLPAQPAQHDGFAEAYSFCVALAVQAALQRLIDRDGPRCGREAFMQVQHWQDALAQSPASLEALDDALKKQRATATALANLWHEARAVRLFCDDLSAPAAQAWALALPQRWPPVAICAGQPPPTGAAQKGVVHWHLRPADPAPCPAASAASKGFLGALQGPDHLALGVPPLHGLLWPLWAHVTLAAVADAHAKVCGSAASQASCK